MAADMPVKSASCSETCLKEPVIGVSSMELVMGDFHPLKTSIVLYCVFPGTEMLAMEQPEQELTAVDSNGARLRVRSVRLWESFIKKKGLRRVNAELDLRDIPSPGARWIQVSGTLSLPLCRGLESLDFGVVELKESGVSIPVPDPVAVRKAQESNGVEIADLSRLETVTLKVTRLMGNDRRAPVHKPGEEWKFMVYSKAYSEQMFQAQDFVFHDVKGARLNPLPICEYFHNRDRGKSFLFRNPPRFVEVTALYQGPAFIRPVPVNIKIGLGGMIPQGAAPREEKAQAAPASR